MAKHVALWPERQHCRKCGEPLDTFVVFRQFCSDHCADQMPGRIEDVPRSCKSIDKRGKWRMKASFLTTEAADFHADKLGLRTYLCNGPSGCGLYHLASSAQ
jgi:hypothetical protein